MKNKLKYIMAFLFMMCILYSGVLNKILSKISFIKNLPNIYHDIIFFMEYILIIVVLGIILRKKIKVKEYLKNFKKNLKSTISYIIVIFVCETVTTILLTTIIGKNPVEYTDTGWSSIFFLVSAVVLGPIVEELTFRGLLAEIISNKYVYYIVSSFVFAIMHFIGEINNMINFLWIVPYFCTGLFLAYGYKKTDNIVFTILIHIIINTISLVI